MDTSQHQCPHCSIPLRIRERQFVGRTVDCPDCGELIRVVAAGPSDVTFEPAQSERTVKRRKADSSPGEDGDSRRSNATAAAFYKSGRRAFEAIKTPLGIAWTVALAFALTISTYLLSTRSSSDVESSPTTSIPIDRNDASPPPKNANKKTTPKSFETRLSDVGERLTDYRMQHGHFPAGTVSAEHLADAKRLSWITKFVADDERHSARAPNWAETWNSPPNDSFVRRRMEAFENPDTPTPVSADRYPATNIVGVAGVGTDAARLPVDHPRAGVFGVDRETRLLDIADGTSNTILAAGVVGKLGSWAAGGQATVRPFTREPYVNGPDGFGTGQDDSMLVLMADGNVRVISADIEPTIMRRMAAMADGLPLDANVPGEPGESRPAGVDAPPQPVKADTEPPVPAVKPVPRPDAPDANAEPKPPKPIDVAALLKQPIARYEQSRGAPFQVVLREFEELLGAPIRYDLAGLSESGILLDRTVRLHQTDTTVGELLEALLAEMGLTYDIEADGIRLRIDAEDEQ